MQKRTRHFVLGSLAAVLMTASMTELPVLEAISYSASYSRLSPELRLGVDIGILDAAELDGSSLNAPIHRRSFSVLLKRVLQMIGAPAGSELSDLRKAGIFDPSPAGRSVQRKAALEALARCTMHLADNGFITLDAKPVADFTDYRIPEKYRDAISYMRSANIVRGYPDGRFGASRALTKKEAVYLLYRYYEQVAGTMMIRQKADGPRFVDLPLDHPAMTSLKLIDKAGGFDQMKFGMSFDGYSPLQAKDAAAIVESILKKHERSAEADQVKTILAGRSASQNITRSDLARLLGHLVKAFPARLGTSAGSFTYTDVEAGTPDAEALSALGEKGLFLGYPNGSFRGDEIVTRYETVGTFQAVLTTLQLVTPDAEDQLAGKSDFEAFAALLKAKRARVQSILHRPDRERAR
ncbi:MAG TPA: S-layer homology domain-containing protein [Candidatus Ozemobacteraceae bacterium]